MNINNHLEYENFIKENNLPIYYSIWWLDIVCKNGTWDACIVKDKSGRIVGVLPYYKSSIFWMDIIRTAPFTPTLGIWLAYFNSSDRNISRYGFEFEVITKLIEQLPMVASYHQIHPVQFENWFPFYWKNYQQTTRYTYVFEKLDCKKIYNEMKDNVRNKIRKAEKFGLVISKEINLDRFIPLLRKTFKRQGLSFDLDLSILSHLHEEIQVRGKGAIYLAENSKGDVHAALYLIWDEETAYCWLSGADTEFRRSGAMQFLIWHSILEASKIVKNYNFEGSMLPHIEPVFRAFGAERKPIFQIRKFSNPFFHALWWLFKGQDKC